MFHNVSVFLSDDEGATMLFAYLACVASVPIRAKCYVSSEDSGRAKLGVREDSLECGTALRSHGNACYAGYRLPWPDFVVSKRTESFFNRCRSLTLLLCLSLESRTKTIHYSNLARF